jgi:hypothetical protein
MYKYQVNEIIKKFVLLDALRCELQKTILCHKIKVFDSVAVINLSTPLLRSDFAAAMHCVGTLTLNVLDLS